MNHRMICRSMLGALLGIAAFGPLALSARQDEVPGSLWKKCDSEIEWLSDERTIGDNVQGGGLAKSPVDVPKLFEKAKSQAKETNRLILWYVPQVPGSVMYRPAILDNYMKLAIWSDESIVDLVKRNFVPFRACASTALSSETKIKRWEVVEPAIILLNADGEIVHRFQRIRTFNADFIHSVLRLVLVKNGKYATEEAKKRTLDEMIKAGDYDTAVEKLMDKITNAKPGGPRADAQLQLAAVLRHLRMKDEALKLLGEAELSSRDKDAVSLERGRLLLAAGDLDGARASLGKSKAPEAQYLLAAIDLMSRNDNSAEERWLGLVKNAADTRWGWRAAANVAKWKDTRPVGAGPANFEDFLWCNDSAYGLAVGTRGPRQESDAQDVIRRAVDWLLRGQSQSGAWTDARYAYWETPKIIPNVRMAVTSLATTALMEWRALDPKRIDPAIEAGEKYILDDSTVNQHENEECYSEAYRLFYFARKHATLTDNAAKKKNLERMQDVISRIGKLQDKQGFWAHEYPNPFCTAAVAQCLLLAQKAGASVDEGTLARASDALLGCRGKGGRISYGGGGPPSDPRSSSCRAAMCEGVLLALKTGTAEDLQTGFDVYWKNLDRQENIRVCDFHSDGELGGFFFWHGFFHTCETAVQYLDAATRDAYMAKFLTHLVKVAEIDGSYLDSHEMGKSYGTAMALLSFKNTQRFKK